MTNCVSCNKFVYVVDSLFREGKDWHPECWSKRGRLK